MLPKTELLFDEEALSEAELLSYEETLSEPEMILVESEKISKVAVI